MTNNKTARRAFGALSALSLLFALGVVGGIEHDTVGLLPGMALAFAAIGLFGLFAWLAGAME